METVKNIAIAVSVASVIIGSVYMITPGGTMAKSLKYVLGLVMLLAIVTPFLGANFDLDYDTPSVTLSVGAEGMVAGQTEYVVGEMLKSSGISFTSVEIGTDISDTGSISISNVHLFGVSDREKAQNLLQEALPGAEVIVW